MSRNLLETVAPTMKRLEQSEPRTVTSPDAVTIFSPSSCYLSEHHRQHIGGYNLKRMMKTRVGKFSLAIVALALSFNLQLPTVLAGPAVTSIAGGLQHRLFSKSDGSLWVMGHNAYGELGIGFT